LKDDGQRHDGSQYPQNDDDDPGSPHRAHILGSHGVQDGVIAETKTVWGKECRTIKTTWVQGGVIYETKKARVQNGTISETKTVCGTGWCNIKTTWVQDGVTRIEQLQYFEPHYHQLVRWYQYNV
jgi:hypothetical protein